MGYRFARRGMYLAGRVSDRKGGKQWVGGPSICGQPPAVQSCIAEFLLFCASYRFGNRECRQSSQRL